MKRGWWLVAVLVLTAAVGAAQTKTSEEDNFVAGVNTGPEPTAVMKAFEPFARAVLARDFVKAQKMMAPEVREKLSADALRARYVGLEAQYGELKKIRVQGTWLDKPSPKWLALVVVKQEHEWNPVQMTYALVEEGGGWKVVWFRPGGKTPGGTFGR